MEPKSMILIAKSLNSNHLLCTWHYLRNLKCSKTKENLQQLMQYAPPNKNVEAECTLILNILVLEVEEELNKPISKNKKQKKSNYRFQKKI